MTTFGKRVIMSPEEFQGTVKKLGGVSKTARSFGVSRSTVYRWMKAGITA